MKSMIRCQSDNLAGLEAKSINQKSFIYCPSPLKKNIGLECKLKVQISSEKSKNMTPESSKISSFSNIDESDGKESLKMIRSSISVENSLSSCVVKKLDVDLELVKTMRKDSMNPHEKNFFENQAIIKIAKTKINEAENSDENEEEVDLDCDFMKFSQDLRNERDL